MWCKNCDKFFSNKKTAKVNLYKISGPSYVKIKLPLPFVIQHKVHKSNIKVSPHYWIICFYSRNICHDIFVTYELCCLFFLFDVLSSKYRNMSRYHHLHTKLSNELLLFVLIKIYSICPILCFRLFISWINTVKYRFFLISLYFKISWRMR